MDLLNKILAHILGNRYYANIINTRGIDKCEIASFIFHTKQDAEQHKQSLYDNRSFMFVETISFRSRKQYRDPCRVK